MGEDWRDLRQRIVVGEGRGLFLSIVTGTKLDYTTESDPSLITRVESTIDPIGVSSEGTIVETKILRFRTPR